jgi:hypothetical protein
MPTQQELKELLHYDPDTGVFTWKAAVGKRIKIGRTTGTPNGKGYLRVKIKGRLYLAHRLAWLYVYGVWPKWPEVQIDHINNVRSDNRIENLRVSTHRQNSQNRKKVLGCTCKLKGASKRLGRFRAHITIDNKKVSLGSYDTEEEAHAAYKAAAEKEFGAFARAE